MPPHSTRTPMLTAAVLLAILVNPPCRTHSFPHLICRIKKLRVCRKRRSIKWKSNWLHLRFLLVRGREGGRREGGRVRSAHEGISANVDELQRLPAAPHCAALHCWSSEHGRILSHMRQNIALPDRRVLIPDPPVQPTNDDDDAAQICRRSAALKLDIARPPSERTTERTSFPSL